MTPESGSKYFVFMSLFSNIINSIIIKKNFIDINAKNDPAKYTVITFSSFSIICNFIILIFLIYFLVYLIRRTKFNYLFIILLIFIIYFLFIFGYAIYLTYMMNNLKTNNINNKEIFIIDDNIKNHLFNFYIFSIINIIVLIFYTFIDTSTMYFLHINKLI